MSILIFKYKDKEYKLSSRIESIIEYTKMYKEYYKNIPEYHSEKEITFDNDSSKEVILRNLKNCINFEVKEDYIIVTYKLNNKEIKQIKQNYLNEYNKFLKVLYSYYKSDEHKEIIKAYLIKFNLKYLIKELNKLNNIKF